MTECNQIGSFHETRFQRTQARPGDAPLCGAGGKAFNALDELSLTVKRGEFICLLGPSGCGKSTALNCIAGLMQLSGGSIWLDEMRIDTLPPEKRGFGMVFQNYALFPHMTVSKNIDFGLRMRGVSAAEIAPRLKSVRSSWYSSPGRNTSSPASSPAVNSSAWLSRAPS
jgi:putative spermidine/putrescine transport system ATP-binding protein